MSTCSNHVQGGWRGCRLQAEGDVLLPTHPPLLSSPAPLLPWCVIITDINTTTATITITIIIHLPTGRQQQRRRLRRRRQPQQGA